MSGKEEYEVRKREDLSLLVLIVFWSVFTVLTFTFAILLGIELSIVDENFISSSQPGKIPSLCKSDSAPMLFQAMNKTNTAILGEGANVAESFLYLYLPMIDIAPGNDLLDVGIVNLCRSPGYGRLPVFYLTRNSTYKMSYTNIYVGSEGELSVPNDIKEGLISYPFSIPLGYIYSSRYVTAGNGRILKLDEVYVLKNTQGNDYILSFNKNLSDEVSKTGFTYAYVRIVGFSLNPNVDTDVL